MTISAAVTVVAASALVLVAPSSAQSATSDVYVVHGVPGVDVDVYVGDLTTPAIPGFSPGDVVGPIELPEGTYDVLVTAAGDAGTVLIDNTGADAVTVPGGITASVVANVANDGETPQLSVFVDDVSPTAAGSARVTVRHTANAPTVDITLPDGTPLIQGLARGASSDALEVPAGEVAVQVRVAGTDTVVTTVGPLALEAGTSYIVHAVGSAAAGSAFPFGIVAQSIEVGQAEAPAAPAPASAPAPAAPTSPAPAPAAPVAQAQPTFTG